MLLKEMLNKIPDELKVLMESEKNIPIVTVYAAEKSEYEGGDRGCTIYCDIWNPSSESLDIELIESYIINADGGQNAKDFFLNGYILKDIVTIRPGAYVRRGEIYLERTAGELCEGWQYGISLKNLNTGQRLEAIFRLEGNGCWTQTRLNIKENIVKQFKNKVERNESMENKNGIRLEGISFIVSEKQLEVLFDVYSNEGETVEEKIEIKCVLYDRDGDILGVESRTIYPEDFTGYDCVKIYFSDVETRRIEKIKILPV